MARRRPNPAVERADRIARTAEDLADLAEQDAAKRPSTARGTRALARRRRATADKIKRGHPYLYEEGSD